MPFICFRLARASDLYAPTSKSCMSTPIENWTHVYMTLFTRKSPYHHLLKYLLFLLKHPVYTYVGSVVTPIQPYSTYKTLLIKMVTVMSSHHLNCQLHILMTVPRILYRLLYICCAFVPLDNKLLITCYKIMYRRRSYSIVTVLEE